LNRSYFCADLAIKISSGDFAWDTTDPKFDLVSSSLTLTGINLEVETGKLVAIVGKVGSGKSSLLSAILGEMQKSAGTVGTKVLHAYVVFI